jgi:hypothetical protein
MRPNVSRALALGDRRCVALGGRERLGFEAEKRSRYAIRITSSSGPRVRGTCASMIASNERSQPLDPDARLANRATLLTLLSLCSFLLALVTMPLAFQRTDAAAPRVIASAPLAVGVGAGLIARTARTHLRAFRDERESASDESDALQPTSDDSRSAATLSGERRRG